MNKIDLDLATILWHSAGYLYWKDKEGRYLGFNKNIVNAIGLPPNEIVGKTDQELLSGKINEENIREIQQVDQEVIQLGKEKALEEKITDLFGKPSWYITRKMPLYNTKKEIIGLIGSSIDITQQKLTEFHDDIINQVPCNLYWKDMNGNYLGCNEALAKLFNLKSTQDIIGKNDYDFFLEPEYVEEMIKSDEEVISSNKTIVREELRTGVNGKHAIYMSKKSPLINRQGVTVGVIGVSIDITREKQAEITKQEFIASMSHDIRTPFSGLYSIVELLHAQEEDIHKKELLGDVLESAEILLKFLNQILELTCLEKFSIHETQFNLRELINKIAKLIKPALSLKSIKLQIDCQNETIKTDRAHVERILLNLLGNAVKFTNKGTITIRVKTQPGLCIEIEDTGIGIPDDQFELIFDKFYRLTPTYKESKFTGAGTGLYISRFLARELKGDITVRSQLKSGSCFTLAIPTLDSVNEGKA